MLPILALGALGESATGSLQLPSGELAQQVLTHPSIRLSAGAEADIRSGVADVRLLSALLLMAENHTLDSVGPIRAGHSYFVKGTRRVSSHVFGRGVDISSIDGAPVGAVNLGALEAAQLVLSFPDELRPYEVGSPWQFSERGSFTDRDHRDHLHLGWS